MILVNGQRTDACAGETIAAVLERVGLSVDAHGVAVCVDGEVVPRAGWKEFVVKENARVELLTAMQGG